MTSSIELKYAEHIISEYGKVLSSVEPSLYGVALSLLPYDKEQIKTSIQNIILSLDKSHSDIINSLTQAYVYLAQFIPDEMVEIAENGRKILEAENFDAKDQNANILNNKNPDKENDDLEIANQAVQTINSIKAEMENLMREIQMLIH